MHVLFVCWFKDQLHQLYNAFKRHVKFEQFMFNLNQISIYETKKEPTLMQNFKFCIKT